MRTPIRNFLEIEITSFCNLRCMDCDRQCRQAPTAESMSIQQIYHFLNEMETSGIRFDQITLLGGEPLTHPQLFEILSAFAEHGIKPYIVTNGYGINVRHTMRTLIGLGYVVKDTKKRSILQLGFDRMSIAPRDYGLETKPCWILESCGFALTRYGFYPCGAGAAIDRVMGFDLGIKSLADIHECFSLTETLCQYCGHSEAAKTMPSGVRITPSWKEALQNYRHNPPKLSLYREKLEGWSLKYGGDST